MNVLFLTILISLIAISHAYAHEEEAIVTNVAQADWMGPLIAIVIISGAMILARIMRKNRSGKSQNYK